MAETLNLSKQVFGRNTYTKVVNTEFTQLVRRQPPVEDDVSVDRFFELYEELFFEIPVSGEINSHEYITRRSSEYIGGAVISDNEKALIEEINSLRQQLLEANKNLVDISKLS